MSWHAGLSDEQIIEGIRAAGNMTRFAEVVDVSDRNLRKGLERRGLKDAARAALGLPSQTAPGDDLLEKIAAVRMAAEGAVQTISKVQSGEQKPTTTVNGDTGKVVTRPAPRVGEPEEWIREAGLDPEEWEAERIKLNTWDALAKDGEENKVIPMFQVTANLKRKIKLDWLFPASDVAQRPVRPNFQLEDAPERVVFFPDQHAPYHDERLHELAMEFMADWGPTRIVNLGDICDFPSISRHRDNPAYFAAAQDCVQGGFQILNDQRVAAPGAVIDLIEGNHDARPRSELLTRAERMYGLRPAQIAEELQVDPMSLRHLLHLDRLDVAFHGPELEGDNYYQGLLELAPGLAAVHGFVTGTSSASSTIEKLGMSVFMGHTHAMRVHHKTKHRGREIDRELVGVECGTMREVRGGGGFAMNPNWQQGFVTATIWPDGEFTHDLARFDGTSLFWRDRRFR